MTDLVHESLSQRSRKPLIIMLVVALLPMCGAYFVYFTGLFVPGNTVNAGKFIAPASEITPLLGEEENKEIVQDKKWRMLIPIPEPCSAACQQNLYTSRQVHIRLDQKSKRLERLGLLSSAIDEVAKKRLLEEHPRLKVLSKSLEESSAWFANLTLPDGLAKDYYILIDQEGRAMMAYDEQHHGNEVLKDLKRAIKYSIDYQ